MTVTAFCHFIGVDAHRALDATAAKQHGLVTLAQCQSAGLNERQVRHCIHTGVMVKVRPGVYRWCGAQPTWRMTAMAAVLAAGQPAALSHSSAGVLWGFVSQHDASQLEITHPKSRRLAGVRAHRHTLPGAERTIRFGIPVTTVERTLLDLGESTPHQELGRLIDGALRRELTTIPRLTTALARHAGPGRRRTTAIRKALADRGAGYYAGANDWEQRMDRLWEELGLPPAERQFKVRTRHRTYKLDRAIVELKIGVEWNGYRDHGTRSGFDYDSNRRGDLAAEEWWVLDFTSNSSPERIVRTVLKACEARRREMRLSA